ncbi:MAG: aspartate kinase [Alphaproteobacteria bacterium]|nr:aspartate kinase [Alphaproteobacteria bacterium]
MPRIVVKFGGTSVADVARIERAADKVVREVKRGNQVAVVVSAMAGVTNQLVEYCHQIAPYQDAQEYDAVVSSGEQVTSGLMALALQKRGVKARSWQGWQVPIRCDNSHGRARIRDIGGEAMKESLSGGEVAVLAGFQGLSKTNRITTLGRGGSDTSAVALAAVLAADRCDIYTDVDGVYTTDPRVVPAARKLPMISYEEMLEMASMGAKVLQVRSVEMAMKRDVPVQVLSSFDDAIGSDMPGTLVTKEGNIMEKEIVSGITCQRNEAKVTLLNVQNKPGVAATVFAPLAAAKVNVDMIVQNVGHDGKTTDITFTVAKTDLQTTLSLLENSTDFECEAVLSNGSLARVSVVGIGMKSHAGVAKTMFETLGRHKINIHVIATSEIKISVLIDDSYAEEAIRALHEAYGLEKSNHDDKNNG